MTLGRECRADSSCAVAGPSFHMPYLEVPYWARVPHPWAPAGVARLPAVCRCTVALQECCRDLHGSGHLPQPFSPTPHRVHTSTTALTRLGVRLLPRHLLLQTSLRLVQWGKRLAQRSPPPRPPSYLPAPAHPPLLTLHSRLELCWQSQARSASAALRTPVHIAPTHARIRAT